MKIKIKKKSKRSMLKKGIEESIGHLFGECHNTKKYLNYLNEKKLCKLITYKEI